ncbi:hypothetical protein L226DRAFT_121005 [Lentinus tigrinus ALCF2SS1-7]|uniref:Uncharacterized protein n=1 Tax=Lentinus tigrinus ALCF2SS1-6 TaxID=1328759 RepID=A0A5C2SSK5_9APHY|nr:hypothetical protein L227DRAFT_6930 [Lentinus tigrinus ALCF2SS1-6]RPD80811.1 hypothetical protein L226DRAFT_121005 [Lentinus tigrinus ALCF2SS1-7]
MYTPSNRRGHRKRLSALRLSSDTTVSTLPLYTSPPDQRHPDLPEIPSDQPPAYPDSAEEADEDTDSSDCDSSSGILHVPSPPPSLPVSPRRARRSQASSRSNHRRQQSVANPNDPYLDSLLARSVHALEMSNALLQSSMSTQTSLSAVLADDSVADRHLEEHAQRLNSRIRSNRDTHEAWMDDLDEITRRVDGLVRGEDDSESEQGSRAADGPISQSLPTTSGFSERMQQRSQRRRASQDFRQHHPSQSTTNLQLSVHDRSHFVSPAPRALTMYIDSSEAADLINLPSTLGVRAPSRPPPTPLPNQGGFAHTPSTSEQELVPATTSAEHHSKAAEMLASYVMPRFTSASSSPPSSSLRRRSSSGSAKTVKRPRVSKSPPPALRLDASSSSSPTIRRSRSTTPIHGSPALRQPRPLTPPIEELSTSSTSSDSATLHVDRTVESLRQILEKQRSASQSSGKGKAPSTQSVPPLPRPSLLSPSIAPPVSGTSNATASISRLFTKPRHTTSTRAPSPPKQSSMKNRSAGPSTPITPVGPSPSPSLLSVPSLFGLGERTRSGGSSGASTPKRISFAEPAESYSSTKPEGSSSKFRATKTRSKSKSSRDRGGTSKGKGKGKDDDSDADRGGWWTTWLLGAAGAEGATIGRARTEERFAYASARGVSSGGMWAMRPGFGGTMDEWGA